MNNGLPKCEGEGTNSEIQHCREFDSMVDTSIAVKPARTRSALIVPPNAAGTIFNSHVHLQGHGAPIEICAQNGASHA